MLMRFKKTAYSFTFQLELNSSFVVKKYQIPYKSEDWMWYLLQIATIFLGEIES